MIKISMNKYLFKQTMQIEHVFNLLFLAFILIVALFGYWQNNK